MKQRKPMKRSQFKHKTRKNPISQADKLLQQAVLKRDNGVCQMCGKPASEGHHIIHCRYHTVRWDLSNVVSLCRQCHSLDSTIHKHKLIAFCTRWVGGEDAMDALRLRANTGKSETPQDAIERLKKLVG